MKKINLYKKVDFATVVLSIILFGAAVAYVMINAVK